MNGTTEHQRFTTVRGRRAFSRVVATDDATATPAMPLLMIHGAIVSSDYMMPLARCLGAGVACHAVDMPGYGRSEGLGRALHVEELADWITEWMDAVSLATVHLFGNSLGAQVAVALAQRHPERVGKLVLVGPTVDPAVRGAVQQLARLAADAFVERPPLHLIWARDFLRAGPLLAWRTLGVALDDAIEARLPALRQEALVVRGARDPLVSHAWATEATRLLQRGRFVELAGAPHGAHYSRPGEVARLVADFLGDATAPGLSTRQ